MKKGKVLLVGLFVLLVMPICVQAKSYTFDGITYELDDNYKVTTKENIDTSGYRPLDYTEEEFKEILNSGKYSLFGSSNTKDSFSINFKVENVSKCGSIASNKKEMKECMAVIIEELKEKEDTDIVIDSTFVSKKGINYYTLEYFKFGGTYLVVTTSYNNKVYTFILATSYSKDDIEENAKKIMDSVTLNGFKASVDEKASDSKNNDADKINEKKNNGIIYAIGATSFVIIIGGISIYLFKKK